MSRYHGAMRMLAGKLPFFSSCVGWPEGLLPALNFLVDEGEEVGRDDFLARADADPEEVPEWDWHIQYFHHGDGVYWFVHSAIEHVYADPDSIRRVQEEALGSDY